ncbi:hypothetical protein ACFL54_04125 [Planctomycetota bacterium]
MAKKKTSKHVKISFTIDADKFNILRTIINQECDDVIPDEEIFRSLFYIENLGGEEVDLRDVVKNIKITY